MWLSLSAGLLEAPTDVAMTLSWSPPFAHDGVAIHTPIRCEYIQPELCRNNKHDLKDTSL